MAQCQYTYEHDYGNIKKKCKESTIPNGKFCVFHDEEHYAEHEHEAAHRFEELVKVSINQNKPLECVGYYLPAINFAELLEGKSFAQPVNFYRAIFYGGANFTGAKFSEFANFTYAKFSEGVYASPGADFSEAIFLGQASFLNSHFEAKTLFRGTLFEQQNKVTFNYTDFLSKGNLSNVSFADTDIARVRFGDKITWGGDDKFIIIEEKWLKHKAQEKIVAKGGWEGVPEDVTLELVLSVYRNLRENYEFRLRYGDAGKFFIKEMELKRKYREVESENGVKIKEHGWFRRHFSLTGLYYHLSKYGESISRPTLIPAITLSLSTLFWLTQSNPSLEPHFSSFFENNSTALVDSNSISTFVGFGQVGNSTQWLKAFERSFADFLPVLTLGGDIKVGVIDYIIKIVGGALTFGLLAMVLRRKFERKYTR